MPENNKTEEFLQKLAPCIERCELEKCVEEAVRMAGEMGIGVRELRNLSKQMGSKGENEFAYVLALVAAQGLEGNEKAGAYNNAGLAAKYIGKLKESEELFKKAIELDPKLAEAHNNYANLLKKELNRKIEAEKYYEKAIELDPKNAAIYNNYANLLKELNRKTEAEKYYKKAIELGGTEKPWSHNNYALLLEELNRKAEAEKHYKCAIKLNPELAEAYSNYAVLLAELSRKNEAEENYKKAIELSPKLAGAYSNYANLLKELGRKTEAGEYYKKAIELDPKLAITHSNYAGLLRESGRFYEAEKEVKIALQIEPNNPYSLGTYGDILECEDYHAEAIKKYHEAIKNSASMKDSATSEIHNNLGWVYAQLKQYKKAEEEFKKAVALDSMNVKAIRNFRKIGKVETEIENCKFQKCLAIKLLLLVFIAFSYYLFWIERLNEAVFVINSTILITMLIFVFFIHQIKRFELKLGTGKSAFEMSTPRTQPIGFIFER